MVQTLEAKYVSEGSKFLGGRYLDIMPILLKEGLTPISPAGVTDLRNQNPTADEKGPWKTWFDTDAGFAVDGKKVYLFPHSKQLREVTPETKLTKYGIQLFNTKRSKSFNKKDLKLGADLTEKQAVVHPLWLALAEGNKERLGQYVQNAFRLGKDVYNYDKMMGFYVPDDNQPILRAVVLSRLSGRSRADGGRNLDLGDARLVGVRSVAPKAREKIPGNLDLENRLGAVAKRAGFTDPKELADALEFYQAAGKVYSKKK